MWVMGQVIAFPRRRRTAFSPERLQAARHVACELAYLLGFFLAVPMLGLMAIHFASVLQAVPAIACIVAAALAGRLTVAAYRRL
jgi:hypothetical protein